MKIFAFFKFFSFGQKQGFFRYFTRFFGILKSRPGIRDSVFEIPSSKSRMEGNPWYRCASYADSFGNQKSLLNPSGLVAKVHETGKTCSSEFYLSRKFEVHNCDGWSNVSREDCVQKCGKNELPSGCPATDGVCKYAHWNGASNWCQVAKDCDFVESFGTYSADRFFLTEVIEV